MMNLPKDILVLLMTKYLDGVSAIRLFQTCKFFKSCFADEEAIRAFKEDCVSRDMRRRQQRILDAINQMITTRKHIRKHHECPNCFTSLPNEKTRYQHPFKCMPLLYLYNSLKIRPHYLHFDVYLLEGKCDVCGSVIPNYPHSPHSINGCPVRPVECCACHLKFCLPQMIHHHRYECTTKMM